ncbi:MAG: hypothetical protein ACLPKE_08040 [Streptosporangiaceae bacterium]
MPDVDGLAVEVREPLGEDELFLLETPLPPVRAVAALADRVVTVRGGDAPDWARWPAVQLGAVALGIRRAWISDQIVSEQRCPQAGCGEKVDVSFAITSYVAHLRPRRPRNVAPDGGDGWYSLGRAGVRFRVPTVADLLASAAGEDAAGTLATRCLDPAAPPARVARAVDRALSAMAPSLDGLVGGACPECGASLALRFDPVAYTLAELRDAFAGLYWETHALASAYGWPEDVILRLPRARRQRYGAMISNDRSPL